MRGARARGWLACGTLTTALSAGGLQAQVDSASVRIVSPAADSYLSGPVLLRAEIHPGEVEPVRVSFFADGTLVCVVDRAPFECSWDAGPAVAARQIRAVASLEGGGRVVHNVRTKDLGYAEAVDVQVVQVTAVVTDGGGRFVKGLPRQAFRVFEDGRPQAISYFAAENLPLDVVVAVDVSSSMTEAMPQVKLAVKQFLSALGATDRVTLMAFNDTIFTLTRRESDAAARLRAVDRLAPWGGTALYDVIVKSLELLGRKTGRKTLVVFTDGEDQSSHATLETAERRLEASDATVYMIAHGRGTRLGPLKMIMERLAEVSGGRALFADRVETLDASFREVIEDLSNQYLLAYPPANASLDGRWRRIRVEVAREGLHVRARQGYRALATPAAEPERHARP